MKFSGPDEICYGALAKAPQPNASVGLEGNNFALVESCRDTGKENVLSRSFPETPAIPNKSPRCACREVKLGIRSVFAECMEIYCRSYGGRLRRHLHLLEFRLRSAPGLDRDHRSTQSSDDSIVRILQQMHGKKALTILDGDFITSPLKY